MKLLDDVLGSLRLQSLVTSQVLLSAPWGVRFSAKPSCASFHLVIEGQAWLEADDVAPIRLETGDFAIIGAEKPHVVRDSPWTEPEEIDALLRRVNLMCRWSNTFSFGGGGSESVIFSGKFRFSDLATNPLLRALPKVLVVRGAESASTDWLPTTLAFLASEAREERPGAEAIVNRLLDVVFVQAIRHHALRDPGISGWLRAVRDPDMSKVLTLIHERPDEPWTVARLADAAGLSRSAFAERFRRISEETPLQYLTRWRMHLAAGLLRQGGRTLESIAAEVGYESEPAFAKAFKRVVGQPPGQYRALHA